MSHIEDEEARLVKMMEKKAALEFDKKRQEALKKYQASGHSTSFQLAEEASPVKSVAKAISPRPAESDEDRKRREAQMEAARRVHEENRAANRPTTQIGAVEASSGGSLASYEAQMNTRDREAKLAREEADRKNREAAAAAGSSSLAAYEAQMAARDREAKQKREEEDRRRKEELSHMSSGLASYEERMAAQDRAEKQKREDEERHRREEIAATEVKQRSYREKQEAEEREFRRKREEEEAQKRGALALMESTDRARREGILKREREEADRRAAESAAAQAARKVRCSACNNEFPPDHTVMVKGASYCRPCSHAATADKCALCKKPILTGNTMKAGNSKYHENCLKCAKCGKGLDQGYRQRGQQMFCIPCSSGV